MTHYYFAYGSNMNLARVRERKVEFLCAQAAVLRGYRLVFNKAAVDIPGIAYANLAYAPSTQVEGVLYQLTDQQQIFKMDVFESAPFYYSREVCVVECEKHLQSAWVYFANPAVLRDGLRPAQWYLNHLLAGRDFLSPHYFAQLQQTAVA